MAARLTLKNSNVQFRNATAEQLGEGEIALNYHESGPYLQCKASNGEIVQLGGTYVSAIAPLNPIKGKQWLNSSNDRLYIYSGSAWVGTQVVNVAGELPEPSAMTTADLNLDQPSTRLLPDSSGLSTQKDLNIWIGDALEDLDGRIKTIEETPPGGGEEINLDGYATKQDLSVATANLPYRIETDKVVREADAPAKTPLNAEEGVRPATAGGEIQLVDNLGYFSNIVFQGFHGIATSSDQSGIVIDGREIWDKVAALEEQVATLITLVPPVDYGDVTIQGGNDYQNGQCWLAPNETGVFTCSLDGSQTHGCTYQWELVRGDGRISGSTTLSSVTLICTASAPNTLVLRCWVSHPTTEEIVHGEITILVQNPD